MDVARCQHDSQKGSKGAELLAANNKILLVTHANLRVVSKEKKLKKKSWQLATRSWQHKLQQPQQQQPLKIGSGNDKARGRRRRRPGHRRWWPPRLGHELGGSVWFGPLWWLLRCPAIDAALFRARNKWLLWGLFKGNRVVWAGAQTPSSQRPGASWACVGSFEVLRLSHLPRD